MKKQFVLAVCFLVSTLVMGFHSDEERRNFPALNKHRASVKDVNDRKVLAQFRTEVDQVVLYAAVYDQNGQLVSTLNLADFAVFENKIQQELTYFGQDDIPSTIGIVMDKSGSMRNKWQLVVQATGFFLLMNNPQNELFLVDFDNEVLLEEDFTRDVEDIRDALDNIIVSGGTALYDAISLAVEKAQKGSETRKVVFVFTDGEDKDSYYSHEELVDQVRESNVQVHIVAFLDPELSDYGSFFGIFKSQKEKIQKNLDAIAEYSGGKAFFPEQIEELNNIFKGIAQELRKQYRLSYVSNNPVLDGNWREINVVVKGAREKGLKVRAKKGYYAKKETAPADSRD